LQVDKALWSKWLEFSCWWWKSKVRRHNGLDGFSLLKNGIFQKFTPAYCLLQFRDLWASFWNK
jgi:hypothetical protein